MQRSWFNHRFLRCLVVIWLGLIVSQPAVAQDESTVTGVAVSSTRTTLTVRTGSGQLQMFFYRNNATRPGSIPQGSQVRVVSTAGNEPGIRIASQVTIAQPAPANQSESTAIVPPEIRQIEGDIERQLRRYQVGVHAGVALDPELVMIGAQAQLGPFFRSDVFFRPNIEFGFGEVTALFAFNPDVVYRLPFTAPQDRTSTYVGAGLGINLLHQNLEEEEGGRRIDFGDFHSDTALNILGGIRYRNRVFLELRTSVYSQPSPTLRLIVGYNF